MKWACPFGRGFVMRNWFFGFATAMILFIGSSSSAWAQTKSPSQPPASTSPGSFDPHDLSGVWMQDRPRMGKVIERYWIYELTLEEPPMTEWGLAQYHSAKSSFGTHAYPIAETNDPIYKSCAPPGFPRAFYHAFPLQIVQSRTEIIM